MASLEEELRLDAEEDAREIEYIKNYLPNDLKDIYSDSDIQYVMDAIVDYYYTSGILDANQEVDVDLEKIAQYVCEQDKDNHSNLKPEDVYFIVQADFNFQEENL